MAVQRKYAMGSGGFCICPKCGEKIAHQSGTPCQEQRCAGCGAKLLREGSYHHQLFMKKHEKQTR